MNFWTVFLYMIKGFCDPCDLCGSRQREIGLTGYFCICGKRFSKKEKKEKETIDLDEEDYIRKYPEAAPKTVNEYIMK